MDIISYVLGSSRTFSELPFNEVDSLVLAQFSYAKLEAVDQAAGRRWRSGARIKDYYMAEYFDRVFCDAITDDENIRLLAALSASRRFRDVVIRDITALSSSERSMQFAAMIFDIDSNTSVAAFRGTDGSLVGWKRISCFLFRMRYLHRLKQRRTSTGISEAGEASGEDVCM